MGPIVDYGTLKAAIQEMLWDRQNLAGNIPLWISLAERKIFRRLRHPAHEVMFDWDTSDFTVPVAILELPGDFLELKFVLRDDEPLDRISDIELKRKRQRTQAIGPPTSFARIGNRLYLHPQADSVDYSYSMVYWQDLSNTLKQDAHTHDVLRIAPDMYLYGSLLHAAPYLLDDERIPTWQSFYDQAFAELMDHVSEAEYAGSTVEINNPYRGV